MRRRPFRRWGARYRPGLRALRSAHELALTGETKQAAHRFKDLAEQAVQRGAANAPQIYLQAGRLFAQSGDLEQAWQAIKAGLTLMNESSPARQLARAARSVIHGLNRHGMRELADRVAEFGSELLPRSAVPELRSAGKDREGGLPGKCPYCGASIDPRDIDWLEADRAICEYCGSLLET